MKGSHNLMRVSTLHFSKSLQKGYIMLGSNCYPIVSVCVVVVNIYFLVYLIRLI